MDFIYGFIVVTITETGGMSGVGVVMGEAMADRVTTGVRVERVVGGVMVAGIERNGESHCSNKRGVTG